MNIIEKKCEGICPVCGSDERTEVDYILAENIESIVFECHNCAQEYTEHWTGVDEDAVDNGDLGEYSVTTYIMEGEENA